MCVCVCVCVLRGSYVNTRGYAHVPMYKEMSVYDLYEEGMQEAVWGGKIGRIAHTQAARVCQSRIR